MYALLTMHIKDIYVLSTLINFPISIISSLIIDYTNGKLLILLSYATGLVQWVFIIGNIFDKYIPKIDFDIKIKFLLNIIKILFIFSFFGLLLSAIVIKNGYISSVIYNISLALAVFSIGFKILFIKKDNKTS